MNKKILISLIALGWLALLFITLKENILNRYFVKPLGITKYTDRDNSFIESDPKIIVPVSIGTAHFDIPAPYLGRVGAWINESQSFDGPLVLQVSGADFSPSWVHKNAITPDNTLFLWVSSMQQQYAPAADTPRLIERRKSLLTIEEYVAAAKNDPDHWFGMDTPVRAPNLDRFDLIAFRSKYGDVLYVGQRAIGGLLELYCNPDEYLTKKNLLPQCRVYGAPKLDKDIHLEYFFSKKYLSDWEKFDIGIGKLFDGFKRN